MKRYTQHLRRELFRYSITVIVAVIVLVAVGAPVALHLSTSGVLRESSVRLADYWEDSLDHVAADLASLSEEPKVRSLLVHDPPMESNHRAEALQVLYDTYQAWPRGSSFVVVSGSGQILATNLYHRNVEAFETSPHPTHLRQGLTDLGDASEPLRTSLDEPHEGVYATAHPLSVPGRNWDGGMLVAIIGTDGLLDQVRAQGVDRVIITDSFDNLILDSSARDALRTSSSAVAKFVHTISNYFTLRSDGVDYFYSQTPASAGDIRVTTLSTQRFFWKFLGYEALSLGVATVLALGLASYITRRQSRRSAVALNGLDTGIRNWFDGDLAYRLGSPQFQEFDGIYASFNGLVDELEGQVEANFRLAESRKSLEIRHLETQFNPHFVYNILEMLRFDLASRPDEAQSMILKLAGIMRYMVTGHDEVVRFGDDLEQLESYLFLQKMRLGDYLTYTITVDDDLREALVPRLILQPLVENALKHGHIDGDHQSITITAVLCEDDLVLEVLDNGTGIETERLDEMNASLDSDIQNEEQLGLFLVNRVVRLLYGDKYGLRLIPIQGGTRVRVTLPFEL